MFHVKENVIIFESTGPAGPQWLSLILNEFAKNIMTNTMENVNRRYLKFINQHLKKK